MGALDLLAYLPGVLDRADTNPNRMSQALYQILVDSLKDALNQSRGIFSLFQRMVEENKAFEKESKNVIFTASLEQEAAKLTLTIDLLERCQARLENIFQDPKKIPLSAQDESYAHVTLFALRVLETRNEATAASAEGEKEPNPTISL